MDNPSIYLDFFNFLMKPHVIPFIDPLQLLILIFFLYLIYKAYNRFKLVQIETLKARNNFHNKLQEILKCVREDHQTLRTNVLEIEELIRDYHIVYLDKFRQTNDIDIETRNKVTALHNRFDNHQVEENRQHSDISKVVIDMSRDIASVMTSINMSASIGKMVK